MAGLFLCSIGTNFTNSRFQFLAIGLNCLEDEAIKFRRKTNRSVLTFKLFFFMGDYNPDDGTDSGPVTLVLIINKTPG
jgi:hypothetical protein